MESPLQSLFPLISRRFQSFAEATDAALDVLADQVPGEIVLGQIEAGDDRLRVLDVRGAEIVGIERGNMLPLAQGQAGERPRPRRDRARGQRTGSTTSTPSTCSRSASASGSPCRWR